jgi:hypothetical protein
MIQVVVLILLQGDFSNPQVAPIINRGKQQQWCQTENEESEKKTRFKPQEGRLQQGFWQ